MKKGSDDIPTGTVAGTRPKKSTTVDPDVAASGVGVALRSAFQATVQEDVPQQLLDLLRRLD